MLSTLFYLNLYLVKAGRIRAEDCCGPRINALHMEFDDPFSAVTLKYCFGGVFKTYANGEVVYKSGKVRTFCIDPDKLYWWWLEDFAKKCGDYDKIDFLFYLVLGMTLANGLRKVYSDLEVLEMRSLVEKNRCIEIYTQDSNPVYDPITDKGKGVGVVEDDPWLDNRPESPLQWNELLNFSEQSEDSDPLYDPITKDESDGSLDLQDEFDEQEEGFNESLLLDDGGDLLKAGRMTLELKATKFDKL
uniref:PB1-like domain-containing protein n=1 Tax=Chenopodium quinoa TaxID=63459 RepID=A0A803M698_CHEQI